MPSRPSSSLVPALVGSTLLLFGCARDLTQLEPAPFPAQSAVFLDNFAPGTDFQAFAGSKTDALNVDATIKRSGTSSLRVTVPAPGDASGGYAGGAFVSNVPRDLSGFTALTFWARASTAATLNVAGLGNDNSGNSRYTAQTSGLPLTTVWTKYIIPIPLAAKLTQEAGAFFFAEGAEGAAGYEIWFDDIQFEDIPVGTPRPAIATSTIASAVGTDVPLAGTVVAYTIGGSDLTIEAAPAYFTAVSSNTDVAEVSGEGVVSVVGLGSTQVTGLLGSTPADGAITINVGSGPQTAAPTPTRDAGSVISIFSNPYTNVAMSFFEADFEPATVTDVQIAGDDVKRYDGLTFAVMEVAAPRINATAMTHFHMDVFTDAAPFRIKLVDFGADGAFAGGDDTEFELSFDAASTPALTVGDWSSLDIPLDAFTGLTGRANISQIVISGGSPTTYLDNIYFYSETAPTAPLSAAPTPTYAPGDVVSMFSNAYTNVAVDTWSTGWDVTDLTDVQVAGNDTKLYTNLVFAGIETIGAPIDASAMTHFRMDIWTPDPVASPVIFKIKWVDLGADGVFGGGNETESEIILSDASTPALRRGQWTTLDIPFSAFPPGLAARAHLGQLIISGNLSTVYVDNVLLHR
jgi:hypothetical protein